ncbi:MAG: hypothetical protein GWN08_01420 [Gemmatimonadetes bacterium]|nr:hypothetical protein [Gemmatimonadota bacterium]
MLSTREERFIDVQQEIDTLCQEFGINLELVTYEHDTLAAEELEFARITVPLQGGYAALRRFLEAVEGSEKFLVVERIALGQGKDGGVLLQLNITLTTYFNAPADAMRLDRGRRA